jgi:hypothetical protein
MIFSFVVIFKNHGSQQKSGKFEEKLKKFNEKINITFSLAAYQVNLTNRKVP